jgi:hypothetical protein
MNAADPVTHTHPTGEVSMLRKQAISYSHQCSKTCRVSYALMTSLFMMTMGPRGLELMIPQVGSFISPILPYLPFVLWPILIIWLALFPVIWYYNSSSRNLHRKAERLMNHPISAVR